MSKSDNEICIEAIGGAWPYEARPPMFSYDTHGWFDNYDQIYLCDDRAAALFRDSGLAWMMDHCMVNIMRAFNNSDGSRRYEVAYGTAEPQIATGPTLLAAIDQAIRTLTKDSPHAH